VELCKEKALTYISMFSVPSSVISVLEKGVTTPPEIWACNEKEPDKLAL
jgi:hypothetical protein